jgi:hypothetical protein
MNSRATCDFNALLLVLNEVAADSGFGAFEEEEESVDSNTVSTVEVLNGVATVSFEAVVGNTTFTDGSVTVESTAKCGGLTTYERNQEKS